MASKTMRLCGQCARPIEDQGHQCPKRRCALALCITCSDEGVHSPNGECRPWWAEGLSEEQRQERIARTIFSPA